MGLDVGCSIGRISATARQVWDFMLNGVKNAPKLRIQCFDPWEERINDGKYHAKLAETGNSTEYRRRLVVLSRDLNRRERAELLIKSRSNSGVRKAWVWFNNKKKPK